MNNLEYAPIALHENQKLRDENERLAAELAAERERADRLAAENNELKIELAKWVHYWRDKDNAELAIERKLKNIYFDEWQYANARERGLREALYLSKRALIAAYDDETGWCDELKVALAATAAVLAGADIHAFEGAV